MNNNRRVTYVVYRRVGNGRKAMINVSCPECGKTYIHTSTCSIPVVK